MAASSTDRHAPQKIPSSNCYANQIQDSQAPSAGGCGVGQFGFFDLNRRYEGLDEKSDDRGDGCASSKLRKVEKI
jgi:hypothetical protein